MAIAARFADAFEDQDGEPRVNDIRETRSGNCQRVLGHRRKQER
jgi:hypothetical protein